MKPELLATLRAAGESATKGPWEADEWCCTEGGWAAIGPHHEKLAEEEWDDPDSECHERAKRDAAFIALARNHWGELLDEIAGLRRDLTEAQSSIVELADEIEAYEAAIEEHLPEYVLDDGTDEPANYLERIEYAGQAARLSLKYRDERDARKARILLIRYENENETIRPEVGTGECIDDLTALVDLDEEVSRG